MAVQVVAGLELRSPNRLVVAALAELTFPVTAAAVGYFAFDATLDGSQWVGVGLTTLVVLLLPITGAHVVRVRGEKLVPATS